MAVENITNSELQKLLTYHKDTGLFVWNIIGGTNRHQGNTAGKLKRDGYVYIKINKRSYLAHRLAWLYMHNQFPCNQIDHINGIKSDNRLCNLRDVSCSANQLNRKTHNRNNKSGIRGVYKIAKTNKWRACITVNKVAYSLGSFCDCSAAETAVRIFLLSLNADGRSPKATPARSAVGANALGLVRT